MTTRSTTTVFRRVVIGFRDTFGPPSSLEAAARFAQLFETELLGVFIEDTEIMEWSAAPLERQFTHLSRLSSHEATDRLAREFSAAADMMRRRFSQAAGMLGPRARFEIERASAASLEVPAAGPEDLLVVVEPADSMARLSYPFTVVLAAVTRSRNPVLYLPNQVRQRSGPVAAIHAGADDIAHRIAGDIAERLGERLISVEVKAQAGPPEGQRPDQTRRAGATSLSDIRHALAGIDERLIVYSRDVALDHESSPFAVVAAERRVPVLVVGGEPPG